MTVFDYKATDHEGRDVAGRLEARDAHHATSQLEQEGLTVLNLSVVEETATAGHRNTLSAEQAEQVVGHVAQLSVAELPLSEGLLAAAQESGDRRVADVLRSIAAKTEQGRSLEDVLASSEDVFPPHISGLVLAAARTGEMGSALAELVEHRRATRSLQRSIRLAFAYPLLVVCLAAIVLLFIIGYTAGIYDQLLEEFGVELPTLTRVLFWWRDTGIWLALGVAFVATLAGGIIRMRVGRAGWLRLVSTLPILGPLWHWSALAEWAGLLSVLIKHEIPLPQALRLASAGVGNANVGRLSAELAECAGQGQSVSQAMSTDPQFPRSLVPLVRWGEQAGMLSEAFATGHDMFAERARTRALLLQTVLPPVLFIAIGCTVLFVVGALFAPIGLLIHHLS